MLPLAGYYTNYNEAQCNFQANEIILVQQNAAQDLRFCGFGALAECNCAASSFDPTRFTTQQTPLASTTSIEFKNTDSVQNILITKVIGTVSTNSNCADCGSRLLSFKDKLTNYVILSWPYRGYTFDALTSILSFDPTQADAFSVLTVTISLTNYPSVQMSRDITATVVGGKTASKIAFWATVKLKVQQN